MEFGAHWTFVNFSTADSEDQLISDYTYLSVVPQLANDQGYLFGTLSGHLLPR